MLNFFFLCKIYASILFLCLQWRTIIKKKNTRTELTNSLSSEERSCFRLCIHEFHQKFYRLEAMQRQQSQLSRLKFALPLLWDSARSIRRDSRFIDSQTFQIVVPMLFQLSTHSRHWDKIRIWTHGWKSALLRDGDLGIFTTHWKFLMPLWRGGYSHRL